MQTIIYNVNTVNSSNPASRETSADSIGSAKDSRGVTYEVTKDAWPTGNNTAGFYPTEQT